MRIAVCSPSLGRAGILDTASYIPFVRVYVDPGEAAEYRGRNPGVAIVECAEGIQGNVPRVRNHILDREFKAGAKVVVIVDDDLKGIYRWTKGSDTRTRSRPVTAEEFLPFCAKYSQMAFDMGAFLWGVNLNNDKGIFREYTPFSTVTPVLGPFQAHMAGSAVRYDERFHLKDDYDFSIQHLLKYRRVLRLNAFHYIAKQSEQTGGCAFTRTMDREKAEFLDLQMKWGREIVQYDGAKMAHMKRNKAKGFDYDAVIRVPIGGI